MPGKLFMAQDDVTAHAQKFKVAGAYCEGRTARRQGAAVGDNPHENPSEAFTAWDAGWTKGAGDDASRAGCAE